MGEEGIQRVPLTSDGSETETEPCDTALPKDLDDASTSGGPSKWRFPAITPITPPVVGVSHRQFCDSVKGRKLPGDDSGRRSFDARPTFVVGDPDARFDTHTPLTYETTGEVGHPCWTDIFAHILRNCSYLTAFDTRNLRAHATRQEGLPHWPAAVAWWQSRLQLVGPKQEKTELLFFPACEQSGLHRVHPTWAGTFVLAALVAVFPGINFILLDSDCLPVTLFEAADLWKEGYLARFPLGTGRAMPTQHPLHRKRVYHNDPRVVYTQHRVDENRVGQGVLLVTEPFSCLAWALLGEWTSRILFPVPKGRHGHAGRLLPEYQARSPCIVAWARACFEQGALPSLLLLQGLIPIFTLPGDKMFQSTGVQQGRHRPPIIHAYGGAKVGMAAALRSIAVEGWVPLAVAMVGTKGKKPMWADLGLRPVIGTTLDIKVMPQPLEDREVDLLLSCWKKWNYQSVPESALNQWLRNVDAEWGPDCVDSPHFRRVDIDCFEMVKLLEDMWVRISAGWRLAESTHHGRGHDGGPTTVCP